MDNLQLVENYNGTVMTTSLKIAEVFDKPHKDVLKKIKEKQSLFGERNFSPTEYISKQNKVLPMYLLDRDFASYLIMGFSGSKADEWKLKYINAFNKMEKTLKESNLITEEEKLKLQLFSKDPLEVAAAHNKLVAMEVNAATLPLKNEIATKNITIQHQKEEIKIKDTELNYKSDVINGLTQDISLADKRMILNRVLRKAGGKKTQDRWAILYREFNDVNHMNLNYQLKKYNENNKPKCKNKLDFIDKVLNKIPELYEIAAKLFEQEVNVLVQELYEARLPEAN